MDPLSIASAITGIVPLTTKIADVVGKGLDLAGKGVDLFSKVLDLNSKDGNEPASKICNDVHQKNTAQITFNS
ncbi:hypothetical protein cym2001_49590 [Pseudomonas sp. CYM-20-01]|nr:hypothetical protein cym2001_49590 [Pseudomonas sp. CYM-20-01]